MVIDRGTGYSLRKLSLVWTVIFSVLVVLLAISLLLSSRLLWRSAERVNEDTAAVAIAEELDRTLREYQRLTTLQVASRDPRLADARASVEFDLRHLIVELRPRVSSEDGARALRLLSMRVSAYLAERQALAGRGLTVALLVSQLRPSFERALESSTALRREMQRELRQAQQVAARARRFDIGVTVLAALVLLGGLGLAYRAVGGLVLRPLGELHEAISTGRHHGADGQGGDLPLAARYGGSSEFGAVIETMARRRREQLTFLAGIAHDLRNPLAALKMLVQSLERDPEHLTKERLGRIDKILDRINRMVGDLLDATSLETGQRALERRSFDLRGVARAMVELYRATSEIHEVALQAATDPVVVNGDPLRLEQAIGNLVRNAISCSPAGGPVVVSVAEVEGQAEVAVSDRGLGISPEELPRLFVPFGQRAHLEGTPAGLGLGLSIVQQIVQAHGGHIEVESEPGRGSTFRVRLPLGLRPEEEVPGGEPEPARPEPR